MMLQVDPGSAVPPFEQLRAQIIRLISTGELAAGSRLPTVRGLAGQLGIAPNTVARAYRELEADGIIETRGHNGSFVSTHGDAAHRQAQAAAAAYAARIRSLGIPPAEAVSLVAAALRD